MGRSRIWHFNNTLLRLHLLYRNCSSQTASYNGKRKQQTSLPTSSRTRILSLPPSFAVTVTTKFCSNFFSNMDVYSLPLPPVDDMWMFLMRTLLPFIVFPPVPPVSNWWMHILELGILKCMLRFRNLQCSDYVGSEKEDFASLSDCFRHIRTTRRMPSMKLPPSRKKSSSWRVNSVNQ